jgi:molybdopterin synthase catalytic subunit
MISLVHRTIDVLSLRKSLARPADGACVVFEGVVRDHARGRAVCSLEYQAYETMAGKKLEEIRARAMKEFAIRDLGIVHRLGVLAPGDCSVAIVVAAAHRAAAFDACRFAIEEIKKSVPIWKKEVYADGEAWIEGAE